MTYRELGERHRTLDWARLSHALLPAAVARRAIDLSVETDREVYAAGDPVRFRVVARNRLPTPVGLRVESAVPWSWAVDDAERASRVDESVPADPGWFRFARRERKVFAREWHQRIRTGRREWIAADAGEHTIRAWVVGHALAAEATVRVEG